MLDLPNWFWNTFTITVFVVINIILWLHQRHCKAKGIKPNPAFPALIKHEKRISKWTDIFIIIMILLIFLGYIPMFSISNNDSLPTPSPEVIQIKTSINYLLLFQYSFWAVFMASLLSFFQKNITPVKRITLLVLFCVPLVSGILYCVFDPIKQNRVLQQFLGGIFLLALFCGPAILLGKSSLELHLHLLRKIPLPWFQFPEQKENNSESSPEGTKLN